MKTFTIKYSVDSDEEKPFWARAYDGEFLVENACGKTFEAAKERLIEKLRRIVSCEHIPQDEEITL